MSVGVSVLHEDPAILDDLAYAIGSCDGMHVSGLGEIRDADVVLAGGRWLHGWRHGPGLVVLSTDDAIADARAGFAAGAKGLLRWPHDAHELPQLIAAAVLGTDVASDRGGLVAVVGARGGAGATTVACLLAKGLPGSLLIDLDFAGFGQLAFAPDAAGGSLESALSSPLANVIDEVAETHASGRALLGTIGSRSPKPEAIFMLLESARRFAEFVVVDAGRIDASPVAFERVIVVCADDVASLRCTRAWFEKGGEADVVLNRRRTRGLRAGQVERVLGRAPVAVLPPDRRLARAADAGVLTRSLSRKASAMAQAIVSEVRA